MNLLFYLLFVGASWQFTDVTGEAGITLPHSYSLSGDAYYIAAGCAAADVDGDGWVDLYVLGGDKQPNALYRNLGNGTFEDITATAGVALSQRFSCGAAFADVDGDGHVELLVGAIGASPTLFHNRGDGTFEDVTAKAGLTMGGSTFSAAFADTDRDGDLDLFLTHWQTGNQNFFYENNGDGTFSNATAKAGFGNQFRPDLSFTPNFADIDGDRWPDLLVASDLGHSQVYRNDGTGRFVEITDSVISDENGMGAAIGDYDNDGDQDWFVSSIGRADEKRATSGNRLYRNSGDGTFEDVTDAAGVREGYWGWGASFADFDNDGWLDIYHVNGFLGPFAPGYGADPSRFFHNQGDGSFAEIGDSLGLADLGQGRGIACFDYDNDGDIDIFVANNGAPGRLLRNDGGNSGNYLSVQLQGNGLNRGAVGARIEVNANGLKQVREIRAGNNFASQDPLGAHFGLADATQADLTITWPDGLIQHFAGVTANQKLSYAQPIITGSGCQSGEARWIAHVTPVGGDFITQLMARNFGSTDAALDLVAFDRDGKQLQNLSLALEAFQGLDTTVDLLFGGQVVSHLAVYAPETVRVTSAYRPAQGVSVVAHGHEQREAGTEYFVYPGDWDLVYDGMAMINLGDAPATVRAVMLDDAGHEVASALLTSDLQPNGKLLHSFATSLGNQAGSLIEVTSSQPTQVLFLRGTHPGTEPGFLYQVKPVPKPGSL